LPQLATKTKAWFSQRSLEAWRQEGVTSPSQTLNVSIIPENVFAETPVQAIVAPTPAGEITYRWELNRLILSDENSSMLQPKSRFSKGDQVSVVVTDGNTSATTSVKILNTPPVVRSVNVNPNSIYRGIDITINPVGYDADGDSIQYNYKWTVNDNDLPNNTPVLNGNQFKRGDRVAFAVIPSDSEGEGEPFRSQTVTIPNGPPRFASTPPLDFKAETYSYQAVAIDPDDDPLTYSLITGPNGMIINTKTGLLTLQIKKEHAGTHIIEIEVKDSQGSKDLQKYSLTLTVP